MSHKALKMDTDAFEWQLDRMFSICNSAIHEINNQIQVAGTYRCTEVPGRVHMSFFHSEGFIEFASRPDKILLAMFMLALQIKFERVPYLNDEGYRSSDDNSCSTGLPVSTQYHQWLKLPSIPQMIRNQQYSPLQ